MVSPSLAAAVELYHSRKKPEARFWRKVRKAEGDGCWEWTGYVHKTGYGYFTFNDKTQRAPRVAWQLTHGPIPPDMLILHSCDNRLCVRPDHLRLGTAKDNTADMISRGRHGFGKVARDELAAAKEEIARLNKRIERLNQELGVERMRVRRMQALYGVKP